MRRFKVIIAAFLLVAALVAVEIIIIKNTSKYEPQISIAYAKVKIPENTVIIPEMLEIKKVGLNAVHSQSIRNIKDAILKKSKMDIEAGEMMLSGKLGSNEMEEISVKDKTKRLYSVEFKADQANGWWLKTDQKVDIILVLNEKYLINNNQQYVKFEDSFHNGIRKLKGVRIAGIIDEDGKLLKNAERTNLPRHISFEVTEEQADFLAFAKSNGRIELAAISDN